MLTRYGDAAKAESAKRAEELAADGDLAGVAVWLRVIDAIRQLAITTPLGPLHQLGGSFRGPGGIAPDAVRPKRIWINAARIPP